jgi:hypothetical protein
MALIEAKPDEITERAVRRLADRLHPATIE